MATAETSDDDADHIDPTSHTFGQVLGQFFGLTPSTYVAEKRPRGRPPKAKPAPPIGTFKNTISDERSDELHIEPHDRRMLAIEFQEEIAAGKAQNEVIAALALLYNLSYRAVHKVVTCE